MTGRIITVRHGQPDLDRDVNISSRDYGDWWARYDESGLHPDERPPESLIKLAKGAKTVLSSTLPRAIETARQATGGLREVAADKIFVEAPLPPPPVPFLRLRPGLWGVISRSFWFWGYTPSGVESHRETWRRVRKITEKLSDYARDGDVMLCAHGYLNWMIDQRLRKEAWVRTERDGGNHYWSWRIYEPSGLTDGVKTAAAAE
ncbi:MAG: histidine phosphatase family protein [Marinicaulis sp.]|nr:histidine phosphatase family protein [Marinicaulis sp.]NNL89316.1 histidine phosphatase family protein [Marinicaulis sp.]